LKAGAGFGAEGGDELGERVKAPVAEKTLEAGLEEVIAGRVDVVAGMAHHDRTQVLEIDGR
jgi:hypothetical protein